MIRIGMTGGNGNLGKTFSNLFKKKFKIIKFNGDITKKKDIDEWIKYNKFDLILHFAAVVATQTVNSNPRIAEKVNHKGTEYLVNSINKHQKKLEWFFYSSTSHVYKSSKKKIKEHFTTSPITKYGYTKLLGERTIIKEFYKTGIKYCIGRIFSISNNKSNLFFLNSLKNQFKKSKDNTIVLKNLNHFRDFITTHQISKIIFGLYKKKFTGVINIGSGKKFYLKKIAKKMAKLNKKKIIFKKDDKTTIIVADIVKLKKMKLNPVPINIKNII